jgi:hypothetical protein
MPRAQSDGVNHQLSDWRDWQANGLAGDEKSEVAVPPQIQTRCDGPSPAVALFYTNPVAAGEPCSVYLSVATALASRSARLPPVLNTAPDFAADFAAAASFSSVGTNVLVCIWPASHPLTMINVSGSTAHRLSLHLLHPVAHPSIIVAAWPDRQTILL